MTDTRDLCLVADVKALMQKSGPNSTNQDLLIQSLITRASIKIMDDTGREFVPGGPNSETFTGATRTFEYIWNDSNDETFVDLGPYDLNPSVVPTVTIDTDTISPVLLTTDQYRLWPVPAKWGVYMAVRVLDLGSSVATQWRHRQLNVVGNWGFPSIPFPVAQATAETVIHWITSYPGARRVDQQDAAIALSAPRSYPMSAVDLLSAFTRNAI